MRQARRENYELSQNIPLDGNLIKEKALAYAKEVGYNDFRASSGWLDRWKSR